MRFASEGFQPPKMKKLEVFFHFFIFFVCFSFASVFAGFVQMRFASEGFKPPKMKKKLEVFPFFHFFVFFQLPRFLLVSSK